MIVYIRCKIFVIEMVCNIHYGFQYRDMDWTYFNIQRNMTSGSCINIHGLFDYKVIESAVRFRVKIRVHNCSYIFIRVLKTVRTIKRIIRRQYILVMVATS